MKPFLLRAKSFYLLFFVIAVFFLLSALGWTARHNVDLGEFIKEITVINVKGNQTQSVIWLPFEFNVNAIGGDVKTQTDSSLKSYLIFMVQCSINPAAATGEVDRGGRQTYASWSQVQNRAFLKVSSSARLRPLTLVPVELSQKLEAIKTAMTDKEDSAGNMHILVFDFNDPNGKGLVDTAKRDKLTLVLEASGSFDKAEFTWHTPFDAVTEAGICPKCSEKIKAKWHYCPWCGNKL
jgi:hypothetical protein